jgi:hypothetical protein
VSKGLLLRNAPKTEAVLARTVDRQCGLPEKPKQRKLKSEH